MHVQGRLAAESAQAATFLEYLSNSPVARPWCEFAPLGTCDEVSSERTGYFVESY